MNDVEIGTMETTIEFEEDEMITATRPSAPVMPETAGSIAGADIARLRELLRPIIMELLENELSLYSRMRG